MKMLLIWPVLLYLRALAHLALFFSSPTIIGIAGSTGKSSTRNALYAVLKDYAVTKVITGNSETGIPLGLVGIVPEDFSVAGWLSVLLKAPLGIFYLKGTQYLIVEMGIDDPYPPKNMAYLLSVIKPHFAIALNISPTHTEQFEKTLKEKRGKALRAEEKLTYLLKRIAEEDTKIITESNCSVGIFNADDPYIKAEVDEYLILHRQTTLLSFGKSLRNDLSYTGYKVTLDGTHFSFLLQSDTHHEKIELFLAGYVLPKEYREVIAAAFLTAYQLGITVPQMKTGFERNYSLPKGRSTLISGIKKSVIIDSSYNASPNAVSAFVELFADLKKQTDRPTVFLFGDMRELGDEAKETHEAIAKKIPGSMERVYLVGPLTKSYVLPLLKDHKRLKEVLWFANALEAGKYLKDNLPKDALVLVKGSQNTIFLEESIKYILENKADRRYLCRQDKHWMMRKAAYFRRVTQ